MTAGAWSADGAERGCGETGGETEEEFGAAVGAAGEKEENDKGDALLAGVLLSMLFLLGFKTSLTTCGRL